MNSPDELLTVGEVVEELQQKVTVQTVATWCREGRLTALRVGRKWVIRRGDLDAFLRRGGEAGGPKKANALAA